LATLFLWFLVKKTAGFKFSGATMLLSTTFATRVLPGFFVPEINAGYFLKRSASYPPAIV